MSALAGRCSSYGELEGEVLFNGRPGRAYHYKKFVGFVPQEDILLPDLTVGELLRFSAQLRLPSSTDIAATVNSVVAVLGLKDVLNSRIGDADQRGISGGQRRRVSVAMELVGNPKVEMQIEK